MSVLDMFNWTVEDLDFYANQVKDVLLTELQADGIISSEKAAELCRTRVVINKKFSKISQLFRRLKRKSDNEYAIIVATIKDTHKDEEIKEE